MLGNNILKKYTPTIFKLGTSFFSTTVKAVINSTWKNFNIYNSLKQSITGDYEIITKIKVITGSETPSLDYNQLKAIQEVQKKFVEEIGKVVPASNEVHFEFRDVTAVFEGSLEHVSKSGESSGTWSD